MQDVLTYEAWLDAVCYICNSLLKANVSVTGNNEFKVTATKYRWITFVDCTGFEAMYNEGWDNHTPVEPNPARPRSVLSSSSTSSNSV